MSQTVATGARPLGITIIAVLLALGGALTIVLIALPVLGVSALWGIVYLALGIADFAIAYSLWQLMKWAFWATVAIEVLALVLNLLNGTLLSLNSILAVIILVYLFADNNVRRAFDVSVPV